MDHMKMGEGLSLTAISTLKVEDNMLLGEILFWNGKSYYFSLEYTHSSSSHTKKFYKYLKVPGMSSNVKRFDFKNKRKG